MISFPRRHGLKGTIVLALLGVIAVAVTGGHAAVAVHRHPFKPRFAGIGDQIRYHDAFVDGHSHSGASGRFAGGHAMHSQSVHGVVGPARYAGTTRFYLRKGQRRALTDLIATGQFGPRNSHDSPAT